MQEGVAEPHGVALARSLLSQYYEGGRERAEQLHWVTTTYWF